MAGVGFGIILVPQLTGFLIENDGWRHAYVGLGVIPFYASPAGRCLFPNPRRRECSKGRLTWGRHAAPPRRDKREGKRSDAAWRNPPRPSSTLYPPFRFGVFVAGAGRELSRRMAVPTKWPPSHHLPNPCPGTKRFRPISRRGSIDFPGAVSICLSSSPSA